MENELPITNLKKIINRLGDLVQGCADKFKDGVQWQDFIAMMPKFFTAGSAIIYAFPQAIKEAADLSMEEIAELAGELAAKIIDIFGKENGV